jgi:hypothetical protein
LGYLLHQLSCKMQKRKLLKCFLYLLSFKSRKEFSKQKMRNSQIYRAKWNRKRKTDDWKVWNSEYNTCWLSRRHVTRWAVFQGKSCQLLFRELSHWTNEFISFENVWINRNIGKVITKTWKLNIFLQKYSFERFFN